MTWPLTGEYVKELRDFITVVDFAAAAPEVEQIVESFEEEAVSVQDRLSDLVFKLRSHSETLNESVQEDYASGYSLGVEAGCEMAAEMIENFLKQLGDI